MTTDNPFKDSSILSSANIIVFRLTLNRLKPTEEAFSEAETCLGSSNSLITDKTKRQ
jgi:hypothetical protein